MSYQLSAYADGQSVELLTVLARTADRMSIAWLVIGAFARDIWLQGVYSLPAGRATADIDIVVQVASWEDYEGLKFELLRHRDIICDPRGVAHRLLFRSVLPLDLIPFGPIATQGEIGWPPAGDPKMNVSGIDELSRSSTTMFLPCGIGIAVTSLSGLVMLKLLAWSDNPRRTRDQEDVFLILRSYMDCGNQSRLESGDDQDLLDVDDFDYEVAGAAMMGRDFREDFSPELIESILPILDQWTDVTVWSGVLVDDYDHEYHRSYDRAVRLVASMSSELKPSAN